MKYLEKEGKEKKKNRIWKPIHCIDTEQRTNIGKQKHDKSRHSESRLKDR